MASPSSRPRALRLLPALLLGPLVAPLAAGAAAPGAAGAERADRSPLALLAPRPGGTTADELVVRLPGGRTLRARRDGGAPTRAGGSTWRGRAVDGRGRVTLAVQDDALEGVVRDGPRVWRLSARAGGALEVASVDVAELPPCAAGTAGAPPPPAAPGAAASPRGPARAVAPPRAAGDTRVDVLFAWTQEAEDAVGGPAAAQALIDLAVLETSTAFEASGAGLELRLVFASWIDYVESGSHATDLARLRDPDDGHMDEVHAWRDAYGADVVSLLVADQTRCGRSYNVFVFNEESPTLAFNLVAQTCAASNLSYAHELGHTFGLDHDRVHTNNVPSWPFAHGFVTPNGQWRTIMALASEGVPATRVPFYSSPYVLHAGVPLGLLPPDPDAAFCALALSRNGPAIAAWRPTTVAPAPSTGGPVAGRLVLPASVRAGEPLTLALDDPWEAIAPGALAAVLVSDASSSRPLALELLGPWRPAEAPRVLRLALPDDAALVDGRLAVELLVRDPATGRLVRGASRTVGVRAR